MAENQIRFEDGAVYERMMGVWSRIAGEAFLDWVRPSSGLRWVDIGCGNGAFTQLLCDRCAPAAVQGIDPSEAQLAYARTRPAGRIARFQSGDAMALPFADDSFDAAAMALVIFFVPDPVKGLAEAIRVVRPGGLVTAYVWDMLEGGYPMHAMQDALRAVGVTPPLPPSVAVSRMDALRGLWRGAGLDAVETAVISAPRGFADFADFWETALLAPALAPAVAAMSPAQLDELKARVRAALPPEADGRIICTGRANAVQGRVPA